jgi:hypothetical protein
MDTRFYVCLHIIAISTPVDWSGLVAGESVLQQQHQWIWVWNGSCDKYMGGTIATGLFALYIGYNVKT